MPVYLDVAARPDDRSFKSAADKAEKYFDDASNRIGKSFSDSLSKGLKSSDDTIRKSAESAAKAYDKAADSAGRVVVEERKLDDLRAKGAGGTAIVAQAERLDKARRNEVTSTRAAVSALKDLDAAQAKAAASGSALSNFLGGLSQGASGTRLGELAGQAENLSTKLGGISPLAVGATAGFAAMAVGVGAATKALYELGAQWDDIGDGIAARTGKMGDELKSVTDVVRTVGSEVASPLSEIGDVAGRVSQSLRLTGQPLEDMVRTVAQLNELTGEQTDVRGLGKAFRQFGVDTSGDQQRAIEGLASASRSTGASVNDLIGVMNSAGKSAKEFGLSFGQTAGLVATLEEAGLDFSRAAPSLTIALKKFSDEGRPAQEALRDTITEIRNLIDAGRDAAAADLASKTFGKGYIDFLSAIKSGKLDVDALNEALKNTGPTIDELNKSTEDWHEEWQKLKNTFSSDLAPAAGIVFGTINDWLQRTTQPLADLLGLLNQTSDKMASMPGVGSNPLTVFAPGGAAASPQAPTGNMSGNPLDVFAPTQAPPGPAPLPPPTTNPSVLTPGMGPNFYKDWYPAQGTTNGEPKLPDAPVLPYDTTVPGWAAGLPASAQNSWMNAHNEVLSKQARLDQLKNAGASPDDIQQAANDLIKANQSLAAAEESLATARQSAYDKETKQLKGHAAAMSDIGAALDNDFGISKGLPGIAENIVKFVGNLAMAGPLAMLDKISQMNPNEGSGLVGIMAANGVFGQKYTPAALSANNGVVPVTVTNWNGMQSGLPTGGAYPGDQALLANVPPGKYSRDAGRDLLKGLSDCSSSIGNLVNIMDGKPTSSGGNLTTSNASEWLPAHGFLPGRGGPGDFRVGFWDGGGNGGHMQATLPGGTPWNWGSDAAAANRGIGGTGADDPSFTDHYYRPAGGFSATAPSVGVPTTPIYPPLTGSALTNPGLTPPVGGGAGTGGGPFGFLPQAAPFGGGQAYPASGGGGFQGVGGLPLDAAMLATSGLDMMAPGAGAAAKIGIQLANRAIGYAGQVAGIATSGVLETLSVGDNPMGSFGKSWFGKLAGGFAGARPALPNMTGQQAPPNPNGQGGQQGQPQGNTTNQNVTINNQGATPDQNGKDVTAHLSAMAAIPGRQ